MKALLFSGGIDSSALAHWLRPDLLLTIDYGQRAANGEISAAVALADELRLNHEVLRADLSHLGQGLMAHLPSSEMASSPEWWPYRNQMLITLAGMRLITRGLQEIIIGAVSSDTHADGKTPFLASINQAMLSQEGRVKVSAPALEMTPEQLLEQSRFPSELLGLTFSCHVSEYACGFCPGCMKHSRLME
jgi:7-cyano-7-deazaguanine synthase